MANLFKGDLVNVISKKSGLSKTDSEKSLNAFIEAVSESLKKGDDVSLIGFGSFKVVSTKARTARNPRTGKEIKVPASKKVKFTVGKSLKDSVKKK